LHGYAPTHAADYGYTATSPDLAGQGLNYDQPYTVRFWYRIPSEVLMHWTYAYVDRCVTLLLDNVDGTSAQFGWTNPDPMSFHWVANLVKDVWYPIEVNITPNPTAGTASFIIRVNGVMAAGTATMRPGLTTFMLHDSTEQEIPSGGYGAGLWDDFEIWDLPSFAPTGVGEPQMPDAADAAIPLLLQNCPNPFNPTTEIGFDLTREETVSLVVHDLSGRRVRTLLDRVPQGAGRHAVTWDGHDQAGQRAASGLYFYRLDTGTAAQTRKMILLK
jgi:hypothetical protein